MGDGRAGLPQSPAHSAREAAGGGRGKQGPRAGHNRAAPYRPGPRFPRRHGTSPGSRGRPCLAPPASPGRTRSPPALAPLSGAQPSPPLAAQLSSGAIPALRPTLRPERGGEREESRRRLSPAVPSSLPAAEPQERRRSCRGPPVPAAAARSPPARRPHTDNMAEAQGSAASRRDQSEARRKRKPHHPLARDVPREGGEAGRLCACVKAGRAPQRVLGAVVCNGDRQVWRGEACGGAAGRRGQARGILAPSPERPARCGGPGCQH